MLKQILKMYKKPRLIILDVILLNLSLFFSFFIRFDREWLNWMELSTFIALTIIGFTVLFFSNLYNKMWQYASIAELKSIVKTTAFINLIFIFFLFFSQTGFSRSIIIMNFILDIFILGGSRFALRLLRDHLICNNNNHKVHTKTLIIGAGDAAEIIIREMNKHPEMGRKIVGLIDDDPNKRKLEIHGIKVLGNRHDIPNLIKKYKVDEVIIAIPSAEGKEIKDIYKLSKQQDVKVKTVPGVYEIINGDINLSQIREVKVEDLLRREQVQLNTHEIAGYLEGRTVLVTGGGGSIGSEICRQVARFNPANLIMLDIYENNTYFLNIELREKYRHLNIEAVIASIRDKDKLDHVFKKYRPDVVFHAAAHKHVPLMENDPEEAVKNNIFGTRNVAEIADKYKTDRFVLISTDKAVNPTNVMGASKRVAEMIIQSLNKNSQTNYMAVRFGNVLGSCGSVIPLFKKQIAEGGPVTVTHKKIKRYFMTIPEAAQLVIQAGALGNGGEVFVLDIGEPVKIIDLARDLIELSGLKVGEDIDIEIIGLRPGEKLFEELLQEGEDIATEHERIFIAAIEEVDANKLEENLEELQLYINQADKQGIVRTLEMMLGNYYPQRDNVMELPYSQKEKIQTVKQQEGEVASTQE